MARAAKLEKKPRPSQANSPPPDADVTPSEDDLDLSNDEGPYLTNSQKASKKNGASSSHLRKRARANSRGETVHREKSKGPGKNQAQGSKTQVDDGESDVEPEDVKQNGITTKRITLPRDTDGYVPGSIVRVKLENFVTYDAVEFRPGPHLNMVLGPNGTGKSTIACALCIGLGWPPSVLGRASELNAFVKHGADKGFVEIELKGKKGRKNLVIRRNINSKNRSSTFTLNGETVTASEIKKNMAKLNVQVENLCTFLPQDKVSEFAQMTPRELLRETQRAAGDPELLVWHDELIALSKDAGEINITLEREKNELDHLKKRNVRLEKEVQRYRERQEIENELALLELAAPYVEYGAARKAYSDLKLARNQAGAALQAMENQNKPLKEMQEKYKKERKNLDKKRGDVQAASRKKFATMKTKFRDQETVEAESETAQKQLDILQKNEKARKKKIQDLKQEIERHRETVNNPPEMDDPKEIQEGMQAAQREMRELKREHEEIHNKTTDCATRNAQFKAQIAQANKDLAELDDHMIRRIHMLTRWDRDAGDAAKWVRENQNRFSAEVFLPPCVSVTVPNEQFIQPVENCFNANQLKTFVTQNKEDYDLLNRLLTDTGDGVGRKLRINVWFRPRLREHLPPPPLEREPLHALGFDGYALDYVECPDGLRWFLEKELNMHRVAIALDQRRVDPSAAMEALTSSTYMIGNIVNVTQRSRYGQRNVQNLTRTAKMPRNLAKTTADANARKEIDDRIVAARQGQEGIENEMKQLVEDEKPLKARERDINKRVEDFKNRKDKLRAQHQAIKQAEVKLETCQKKLIAEENAPSIEAERARLKGELIGSAKKRAKIALDYRTLIQASLKDFAEVSRLGLEVAQSARNLAALDELADEHNRDHQAAQARFQAAQEAFDEAKNKAKRLQEQVEGLFDQASDDVKRRFEEIPEEEKTSWTFDEITTRLAAQKATLQQYNNSNAHVLEEYENRQKEIARFEKQVEEREYKARNLAQTQTTVREKWYPALQQLVTSIGQKFSNAFDRINCAGEINIAENDDYDKWQIDIRVKFRDNEKMALLTGQRQSGGERSLTTILYLLSLTEMARAPFSLVDEINQGMDQRAERAVHNQLVEATCQAESGQYFLITPKLLPGLLYHEKMRILTVYNGEWLPDDSRVGDMMGVLKKYVAAQA